MLFKNMQSEDKLIIGDKHFSSRLFTGTGKFNDQQTMVDALKASKSELVTMALKRVNMQHQDDDILAPLIKNGMNLLPNTSGARNAKEALFAAELAREALQTNWVKLEIHPDPKYLLPLPYIHADPVLCKHLEAAGCAAVMPLGAPIGSNKGIKTAEFLDIIIEQANVPVIVDAGLGSPSHAALAMEMGADAVLVNTAIAVAGDPVAMSEAFAKAVEAGRQAYLSGLGGQSTEAVASSPLTAFLEVS